MAGDLTLQLLQQMQREMQEMRAEIAAREDVQNRPATQSVHLETIDINGAESSQAAVDGVGVGENNGDPINNNGGVNRRGERRAEHDRDMNVRRRGEQNLDDNPLSRHGGNENDLDRERRNDRRRGEDDHTGANFDNRNDNLRHEYERQNPTVADRDVDRIDQAEGLHPFTMSVMRTVMPENKVLPTMERYGGSTDPVKHLRSFIDAMAVYSSDEMVWCRVFSLSLKGEALDWFHSLPPRTIDCFATLRRLFSQQYISSKTPGMTYTALMRIKQGREESLKTFMERFNRTTRQVRNIDQRLIISALTSALKPGPFVDYLYAEEPQTMAELQHRLTSFIRIEEGRAHYKG
ncbi:uncharacterized protein LOC106760563 [Vigna radiata var. radiata]|uniref:Uncharacterized protein LOC106760563 n=1 Tax=Vigna radiata var. radiata TaxID=3916 RepID=A0A1S3U0C4_VIGRR|nr:uncharacterized protein LOC106760563 [Vigna radiata var. radiata]